MLGQIRLKHLGGIGGVFRGIIGVSIEGNRRPVGITTVEIYSPNAGNVAFISSLIHVQIKLDFL